MRSLQFFFLISLIFFSCVNNAPVDEHIHFFTGNQWMKDMPVEFNALIKDTDSEYRVEITINHTGQYLFSNFLFNLLIITPDGGERNTDFEIFLKDDNGNFTGTIYESGYLFHFQGLKRTSFHQQGIYTFRLQHHMPFDCIGEIISLKISIFKIQSG